MYKIKPVLAILWSTGLLLFGCMQSVVLIESTSPQPKDIIDLGALVTTDLPERMWGKGYLTDSGYFQPNSFDVRAWEQELAGGTLSGSNSYYTLFNHGGPHVDAPNHVGLNGGLDSFPVGVFSGPVKVFDVSKFASGRTVDLKFFAVQEYKSARRRAHLYRIHTTSG